MRPWLSVIGIGEEGVPALSEPAKALIGGAELIVGGARHLAMVPEGGAERRCWERPLRLTVERIAGWRGRPVAVLASGDPMCYGVGVTLARRFDPAEMTILPQPGAFTLAAARLAWPLADCVRLTLHGRPLDRLALHLAPGQRLLILSEDGGTPAAVARLLASRGWGPSAIAVLEHMGGAAEARIDGTAEDWGERRCADLNTIGVICRSAPDARALSRAAGLPDDAFLHDGQLTKRELRAATIAALAPLPGQLLWDVGAGCGSVAIEWLRAGERMRAVAIEERADRRDLIARNAVALGVPELRIIAGTAPAALAGLTPPDAIFLGGGIADAGLIEHLWAALPSGGRLVANAVTLAGEARLASFAAAGGGTLTRIAVSRAAPLGAQLAWRPLLPVTQLAAVKP